MSAPVTAPSVPERVAAGMAFMDVNDPGWWRADAERAIDLRTLNLGDGFSCILGQRCPLEVWDEEHSSGTPYTTWGAVLSGACTSLGVDDWAARHGFQVADDPDIPDDDGEYAALTAEWRRHITERRAAA